MTARNLYEGVLIELNKENAPNVLLEDFNYFANKAINNYINKRYNIYDINQQTTDDLRVLKATAILDAKHIDSYNELSMAGSNNMATYEVIMPSDYLHILNCICIYKVNKTYKCYNRGDYWRSPATRLTADMYSQVLDNFWNKPTYKRPYYYIHNVNQYSTVPTNPILELTSSNLLKDFFSNHAEIIAFKKNGSLLTMLKGSGGDLGSSKYTIIRYRFGTDLICKKTTDIDSEKAIISKEVSWSNINKELALANPDENCVSLEGFNDSDAQVIKELNYSLGNRFKFNYDDNDSDTILAGTDVNHNLTFSSLDDYHPNTDETTYGTDAYDNDIVQGDSMPTYIYTNSGKISNIERGQGIRYGNVSLVRLEIRYGTDNQVFELEKVYVDYIKAPQNIRLTQQEIDLTEDTSQMLEYPDYVCQEIINELVHLIMENISDLRLQTHPVVTLSIANPAQQLAPTQEA